MEISKENTTKKKATCCLYVNVTTDIVKVDACFLISMPFLFPLKICIARQ